MVYKLKELSYKVLLMSLPEVLRSTLMNKVVPHAHTHTLFLL